MCEGHPRDPPEVPSAASRVWESVFGGGLRIRFSEKAGTNRPAQGRGDFRIQTWLSQWVIFSFRSSRTFLKAAFFSSSVPSTVDGLSSIQ